MEIKFKDGQLQKLDFTDNDYQKFDGVLALILNRLKRKIDNFISYIILCATLDIIWFSGA